MFIKELIFFENFPAKNDNASQTNLLSFNSNIYREQFIMSAHLYRFRI